MADFHDAVAFPNLARKAVLASQLDYQQKMKDMFKDERALALRYYKGRAEDDYMSYITKELQDEIPTPSNNITKRIIDRTSLVYNETPIRSLGEDYDMAKYKELTKGKDVKLQIAERRTNLLGLIAVKLTWRDGKIEYENILDFEPFFDEDTLKPVAVTYPISAKSTVTDLEPERWIYWDKDGWIKYERGGKVLEMSEPGKPGYGILPFVFCFTEQPESYFLDISVDRELIFTNRVLNVLELNATANVIFRSHGQKWASGITEDTILTGGQDIIITLPEGASLGSTSPEDTIVSVGEAMNRIYKYTARNHHLPEDFVTGAVLSSAASIVERSKELTDVRRGDVVRWRDIEERMYPIEIEMFRVEAGIKLPKATEFSIDYEEDYIEEDAKVRRERWDWERERNWATNAQQLMEENPDRFETEEDAQAFIDENKQQNGGLALSNALAEPVI